VNAVVENIIFLILSLAIGMSKRFFRLMGISLQGTDTLKQLQLYNKAEKKEIRGGPFLR